MTKKKKRSESVNDVAARLVEMLQPSAKAEDLPSGFLAMTEIIEASGMRADAARHKMLELYQAGKVERIRAINKNGKIENFYRPK